MRWHVAAVAAVWLVIMGWCGSLVVCQPVTGIHGRQPRDGRLLSEVWTVDPDPIDDSATQQDEDFHQELYYFPTVPIKRQTVDDDSGWLAQSQDRSKRQSQTHSGSSNQFPQLSIVSPIEALRSRLRLEMLRRQWDNQLKQNQDKFERAGKRRKRNVSSSQAISDPTAVHGRSDEKRMSETAVASAIKEP